MDAADLVAKRCVLSFVKHHSLSLFPLFQHLAAHSIYFEGKLAILFPEAVQLVPKFDDLFVSRVGRSRRTLALLLYLFEAFR